MFLEPDQISEVFVRIDPIDFRKGLNGMCGEVSESFVDDNNKPRLFVFSNRSRKLLRIVYWDETGYSYWHKRLEANRFSWPTRFEGTCDRHISTEELRWMLSGIDIDKIKKHDRLTAKSFM